MQAACCCSSRVAHVLVGRHRTPLRHLQPCHGPAKLAQPWLGTVQRRQHAWVPAAGGSSSGWKPEDNRLYQLLNSKMMQGDLISREWDALVAEMTNLTMMASKFPDFDLAGKRTFLDKFDDCSQRYRIFNKRLELSDDPAAKEYLRYTNAQMLEGGLSLPITMRGYTECLGALRAMMEQEERCSADPMRLAHFKAAMRDMWAQGALGRFDMAKMGQLMQTADTEKVMRAQSHPEFFKAIGEVADNPTPEVWSRWLGHEDIGPFIGMMWKSMQGSGGPASFQ